MAIQEDVQTAIKLAKRGYKGPEAQGGSDLLRDGSCDKESACPGWDVLIALGLR